MDIYTLIPLLMTSNCNDNFLKWQNGVLVMTYSCLLSSIWVITDFENPINLLPETVFNGLEGEIWLKVDYS